MNPATKAAAPPESLAAASMGARFPVKSLSFFTLDHRCKGAYDTRDLDCSLPEGRAHHRADFLPGPALLEVRFYEPGASQPAEVRYVSASQASFVLNAVG